jgi:hypothetical protein
VALYGQPVQRTPILIRVVPAEPHIPRTTVRSSYNSIIAQSTNVLLLQLCDTFGNALTSRALPAQTAASAGQVATSSLVVEGPSDNNPDGVKVTGFTENGNGTVSVTFTVSKPNKSCVVAVRLSRGPLKHVVTCPVEVLTPAQYKLWLRVKSGAALAPPKPTPGRKANAAAASPTTPSGGRRNVDFRGLYFRKAIRAAYIERRKKEFLSLGLAKLKGARLFPPETAKTSRVFEKTLKKSKKGSSSRPKAH